MIKYLINLNTGIMLDTSQMIILKFGGGVLKDIGSLQKVVSHVLNELKKGVLPVIVVSAFNGATNSLIDLAHTVHHHPPQRELALLLTAGERISMSLLAMALHKEGIFARSFTGSQVGIITTRAHCRAKILKIKPDRLLPHLKQKEVVIIAGFQGVSEQKDVTTLKRGGGDISAVALAQSLSIPKVRFYKDVPGLFKDFPQNQQLIKKINYSDALEVIRGSSHSLIHPEAIELAEQARIRLEVQHVSFGLPGTLIQC